MKKIILVAFIFFCSEYLSAQQKQKPDAFKSVKQDTTTAFTKEQLAELALKIKTKAYSAISKIDKNNLDKQLKKLEEPDTIKRLKAAYDLSSAAMMMMATSQNKEIAIVLCTAPAVILPADVFLISNFTAILRMLDSVKVSLPVLLYAKKLDPQSPVILTNLGNTLFELYDDRSAEVFFKRALKIDNHFKDARSSLVSVYLKRKELGKAYEELLKGVEEVTYTENTAQQFAKTKYDPARQKQTAASTQTPPSPGSQASSSGNSGSGGTPDKLVLPPFPDWSDMQAFLAAEGPKKWVDEISKGIISSMKKMGEDTDKKISKIKHAGNLSQEDQDRIMNPPLGKIMERNEYAMDLMQQYTDDRFNKINKDYFDALDKSAEKFNKSVKLYGDAYVAKMKVIPPDKPEMGAKILAEYCVQMKRLVEDEYGDWKNNARTRHGKMNDLLQEYWVYCEQYLNKVYDEDYDKLNHQRMFYAYSKLYVLAMEYQMRQFGFAGMLAGSFTNAAGNCGDPANVPPSAEADMNTKVPDSKAPSCPEGEKVKVAVGPASIGLDCESIEFEYLEGLGASVKWNWVDNETTLGVFVGVKNELALGTVKVAEASFKQGITVTFNKDGQPTDIALVQEAGASVNVRTTSVGYSANMTLGAVVGVKTELTREYAYAQ